MEAADRTVGIGSRASDLMRAYSRCASPRCYEVWYTFVTGLKPKLNEAVKALVEGGQSLTAEEIDRLHEAHLSSERLSLQADRTSNGLLLEMNQVIQLIETALGSTTRYGDSLEAISGHLAAGKDGTRIRDVVGTLITATRSVASSNQELESRLLASRGEVEGLRRVLEEVRAETLTDPLTGIANRKHFEMTLTASVARGQVERRSLTLVVIDIDHFKRFNDTYGHLTGDQVLRLVAAAMRENVAGEATLARFGGEEFAMILPNMDEAEAFACAETIRRNVMGRELLKRSSGESLGRVTISLGIAQLRGTDTASSLLERADLCMYRAKEAGRNRTVTDWDPDAPALSKAA